MKIEIKNRWNAEIIVAGDYANIKDCLEKNRGSDLEDAALSKTDLTRAYLRGVDLRGAYLEEADLREANLRGADFCSNSLSDF